MVDNEYDFYGWLYEIDYYTAYRLLKEVLLVQKNATREIQVNTVAIRPQQYKSNQCYFLFHDHSCLNSRIE